MLANLRKPLSYARIVGIIILVLGYSILSVGQSWSETVNTRYRPERDARIALLVGNSDYATDGLLPALGSPCRDATELGKALVHLGWKESDVRIVCQAKKPELQQEIDKFIARFQGTENATALFFFSGHGIQANDSNYLFGVDAAPDVEKEAATLSRDDRSTLFRTDAISISQDITSKFGQVFGGALVLVLDACRDNPLIEELQRQGGVRTVSGTRATSYLPGVVVAYSTMNGAPSKDGGLGLSPYTRTLIQALRGDVSIDSVINTAATKLKNDSFQQQIPTRVGTFDEPPQRCLMACVLGTPSLQPQRPRVNRSETRDPFATLADGKVRLGEPATQVKISFLRSDYTELSAAPILAAAEKKASESIQARPNLQSTGSQSRSIFERTPEAYITGSQLEAASSEIRFDVFWCSGDALSSSRQLLAAEVGATLSTWAKKLPPIAGAAIGSVKVRNLPPAVNAGADYKVSANILRYRDDDPVQSAWAHALADSFTQPITGEATLTGNRNYIPIYICGGVNLNLPSVRVYMQIAQPGQNSIARSLASKIANTVPQVAVASGIDLKPSQSPPDTEVRYFRETERESATAIAAVLAKELDIRVEARMIPGYSNAVRSVAFVEVWLGHKIAVSSSVADSSSAEVGGSNTLPLGNTGLAGIEGFVFVGNSGADGTLQRASVALADTQSPISDRLSPVNMIGAPGSVVRALVALRLREEEPPNDSGYYNNVKSLGVVPAGANLLILSDPVIIRRPMVAQTWVRVRVIR